MRMYWLLALAAAVVMVSGCETVSLAPIYTQATIVRDDRIVGDWMPDDEPTTDSIFRIERREDRYKLMFIDPDGGAQQDEPPLELVLTTIGNGVFFNVTADPESLRKEGDIFVVPVHYFGRLSVAEGRLEARMLSREWLRTQLSEESAEIAYTRSRDGQIIGPAAAPDQWKEKDVILLCDSTDRIRALLEESLGKAEAWIEPLVYVPAKPAEKGGAQPESQR